MFNPKLKEMFPNEYVQNALKKLCSKVEPHGIQIGILGQSFEENDVLIPDVYVIYSEEKISEELIFECTYEISKNIQMKDESGAGLTLYGDKDERIVQLWV